MATSGEYLWSPDLAEMVDEAFERCRVDPATLDSRHISSARRSINFMLTQWAADDYQSHRIDRVEIPTVQGQQLYTLQDPLTAGPPPDNRLIDVLNVVMRRENTDTPVEPYSRQAWLELPNKDYIGRPSRIFVDKRQDSVLYYLWPVPENSTDVIVMDTLRRYQDVGGELATEPDIPYYMRDAFASGLAARLAEKFAPEQIIPRLLLMAEERYKEANGAQRERGDVYIVPTSNSRARKGRRRH